MTIGTATVATALVVASSALFATPVPVPSGPGSGRSPARVAAGSGVVVNEFAPGVYVELRNTSSSTVDIGGYHLWLCGPDGLATELRVGLGRPLDAGAFYLVASSSYTGAPADQTYRGPLPGGGAVLLDRDFTWTDGTAVVADSPCGEGTPAPACPLAATARDVRSTDTGDNVADFSCRDRSPGETNP
ncbi:hypothetical protein [Actinophytocola sp. KF-1]